MEKAKEMDKVELSRWNDESAWKSWVCRKKVAKINWQIYLYVVTRSIIKI